MLARSSPKRSRARTKPSMLEPRSAATAPSSGFTSISLPAPMARAFVPSIVLAVVYLIWAPPSADLAAQTFRVDLFEAQGYEIWSNAWYSGFHLPGYSLVYPPLASIFGMRLVAAVSAVVAAALFAALVIPRYGDRANVALVLFGAGTATSLFSGRLTFALGVAF